MSRVNFKCVLITRPWLAGGWNGHSPCIASILGLFATTSSITQHLIRPSARLQTLQHYDVTRRDSSGAMHE